MSSSFVRWGWWWWWRCWQDYWLFAALSCCCPCFCVVRAKTYSSCEIEERGSCSTTHLGHLLPEWCRVVCGVHGFAAGGFGTSGLGSPPSVGLPVTSSVQAPTRVSFVSKGPEETWMWISWPWKVQRRSALRACRFEVRVWGAGFRASVQGFLPDLLQPNPHTLRTRCGSRCRSWRASMQLQERPEPWIQSLSQGGPPKTT